jgi:hypothetical protein
MKLTAYKKEDRTCLVLLIVFVVLVVAYLVSMVLWLKGVWNVPFASLKVRHAFEAGIWAKTSQIIYKWSRKNIFSYAKG